MEFVGANRDKIGIELIDGGKREFAESLNGVGVKNNVVLAAYLAQFLNGLERSHFIVGRHDRDQRGIGAESGSEIGRIDQTLR